MGAGEWAAEMVQKMEREYGVDPNRSLQITNRVRQLVSNPDITALQEAGLLSDAFISEVAQNLITLLNDQDEATIEGRWNALVKERGIYALVGTDALLYDPGYAGLDPDKELVSDDGESITIQEAMVAAWRNGIPIDAIPQGIRLGNTEYQTGDKRQLSLSELGEQHGFDQDALNNQLDLDLQRGQIEVESDLIALEDVDFSKIAPRHDCVIAIVAARRHILEHGGASRDEIIEALEDAKTTHSRSTADRPEQSNLNRDWGRWWDEVVAPGLRSLSDIREPVHESGHWISKDVMTGGFESEALVKTILDSGYLFEIGYVDDNDEQRVVGYHDEITRPSAQPLNGPPVFRFKPIVEGSSIRIRLPDLRELNPISFEQLPEPIWDSAASEVAGIADENAEQIPLEDVEFALEAIQNDQVTAATGLQFIATVFREREAIRESIGDEFEAMLHDRVELVTDREQAEAMAECFANVAEAAPVRVLNAVPAMASAANSATLETRRWLFYAFSNIAEEYPEELLPAVGVLIDCIGVSDETLRTNALSTLGKIVQAYPHAAGDITDSLADLLTSDDALVRMNAAGLLGDIAQSNPETVIELASELAESLTAEDEQTRVNASIALLRAGEANPEAIRGEHEQLATALSDSSPIVRANTCTLIGNSDAPVPVEKLRSLEDDPDERVQETAAWALDRIS